MSSTAPRPTLVDRAAAVVRSRFPKADRDPYQRAARDALLKILFAGENIEKGLKELDRCIRFFIEDVPASLSYAQPRSAANKIATKLEVCAREMRHAARVLRDLEAYVSQFDSRGKWQQNLRKVDSVPQPPAATETGADTTITSPLK